MYIVSVSHKIKPQDPSPTASATFAHTSRLVVGTYKYLEILQNASSARPYASDSYSLLVYSYEVDLTPRIHRLQPSHRFLVQYIVFIELEQCLCIVLQPAIPLTNFMFQLHVQDSLYLQALAFSQVPSGIECSYIAIL